MEVYVLYMGLCVILHLPTLVLLQYLSDETSGQSITFEVIDLDDGPAKDELLGR